MSVMSENVSSPILDLIRARSLLDDLQIEEVLQKHARSGKSIGEVLQDFGLVDLDTQLQLIADSIGSEVVQLESR